MIQIQWRCQTCDMTATIEVADLDTRMSKVQDLIKADHDGFWASPTNHMSFEIIGATGVTDDDLN